MSVSESANDALSINKWAVRGRVLWLYTKYQLVTKLLVAVVILPIFNAIMSSLVKASGRTNLSSGDFTGFFLSIYGIPVILLGAVVLVFVLAIDINTFIIISSLVEEGKLNIKMRSVLLAALRSSKLFFSPLGIVLVVYVALVLPLLRVGISLGPLKNFKIPNFITAVIFNKPLYTAGYSLVLILLFLVGLVCVFTVHFMLIDGQGMLQSLRSSRLLMKKYWKRFIVDYVVALIKVVVVFALVAVAVIVVLLLIDLVLGSLLANQSFGLIMLMLSISEVFGFLAFLFVPIAITILTKLFYRYNRAEGKEVKMSLVQDAEALTDEQLTGKIRTIVKVEVAALILLLVMANTAIAAVAGTFFDEFFKTKVSFELIAHRGGGDLGAENTVQGIEVAIQEGVAWTEIDIQRTKDDKYVINHDPSFARVAGVDKTPMEMTLEEIRQLQVKNEFQPDQPSQPVPTFEEILDAGKGKIGVFAELKGKSADKQMVDDVVAMVEKKGMLDEVVILSLNYDIIQYTAEKYPQIKTGFLYYFSTGDVANLKGDYLIMEEAEATPEKIDQIHAAGKQAVVWTVNSEESINEFIASDADGIITDRVTALKSAIKKANERSHLEIILDSFVK